MPTTSILTNVGQTQSSLRRLLVDWWCWHGALQTMWLTAFLIQVYHINLTWFHSTASRVLLHSSSPLTFFCLPHLHITHPYHHHTTLPTPCLPPHRSPVAGNQVKERKHPLQKQANREDTTAKELMAVINVITWQQKLSRTLRTLIITKTFI